MTKTNIHEYINVLYVGSIRTTKFFTQARLSFPSGHASFCTQAMVFLALYLQARLASSFRSRCHLRPTYLVPLAQSAALAFAAYVCVTRINDHKHHPADVLAGAALGALVQGANQVKYRINKICGISASCIHSFA